MEQHMKIPSQKSQFQREPPMTTPKPDFDPNCRPVVVMRRLEWFMPYGRNPRQNDHAIPQMCAAIQQFGFKIPILARSDGSVIDGHLRLKAGQQLNLTELPVILCDEWTEAQVKAFRLLVNRSASWADWDEELLRLELEDLQAFGFDLVHTGFDLKEIDALLIGPGKLGLVDEDDAPPVPTEPVSEIGDIVAAGDHRIACGDSTDPAVVAALMQTDRADSQLTDPPFGQAYGGGRGRANFGPIRNDDLQGEALQSFLTSALRSAVPHTKPEASAYVFCCWENLEYVRRAMTACRLEPTDCLVWDKERLGLGYGNYRPQFELVLYRSGSTWYGERDQSDVWRFSRDASIEYQHPTQKPIALIERSLQNSTKTGDVVLDLFAGSGSVLIAAEKCHRQARVVELEPQFVDVIVRRWQAYTGRVAILTSTGASFDDTARKRSQERVSRQATQSFEE
jgi:DNA modification methylase